MMPRWTLAQDHRTLSGMRKLELTGPCDFNP